MVTWPIAHRRGATTLSVESWNQRLRQSMGACWSAEPPSGRKPDVSFSIESLGTLSILAISVSSPIRYDSVPERSPAGSSRIFYIHMGSAFNRMCIRSHQIVQQPGECMLGDSSVPLTAACDLPHSTLCAGIPADMLRVYLPEPERFVGKHLDRNSTYYKIVPTLLATLYRMAAADADEADGSRIANGLLRAFAQWCAVSTVSEPEGERRKIRRSQVRQVINAYIRDPSLSVESIAERMGVSTRCLQLLFARDEDCVSGCIRRERLRGCLFDLRDASRAEQSITEIAFSWGFNSASHFSSSFRKEYGLTARDYRHRDYRQLPEFLADDVPGLLVLASEQHVS